MPRLFLFTRGLLSAEVCEDIEALDMVEPLRWPSYFLWTPVLLEDFLQNCDFCLFLFLRVKAILSDLLVLLRVSLHWLAVLLH